MPERFRRATVVQRLEAILVDLAVLVASMIGVALMLPHGPPPAAAMVFFEGVDFGNYFTLVGVALAILAAFAWLQPARGPFRRTPGQILAGIRLVQHDGSEATRWQLQQRVWRWGLAVFFIMVPGPLLALAIGVAAATILALPFTTTDRLLSDADVPNALRLFLYSLSFIALGAALMWFVARPIRAALRASEGALSILDRESGTMLVVDPNRSAFKRDSSAN